jgi:large subunit ribosomal protein L6
MSRIGKKSNCNPAGVTVEVKDGIITVKGKMVNLQEFSDVTVTVEDGSSSRRSSDHKDQRAKHGL